VLFVWSQLPTLHRHCAASPTKHERFSESALQAAPACWHFFFRGLLVASVFYSQQERPMQASPATVVGSSYSSLQLQFSNGVMRHFYFRTKSCDELLIKQIFGETKYGLKQLRRSSELAGFLHAQCAVGKRPLVVDAGANIGASSIFFSNHFPNSFVVAVEPHRENYNLLRKNTEGASVEPLCAAVSSTPGHALVLDPGEGHWGYRTEYTTETAGPDVVACVTINDLYRRHCAACFPFIVKIDIEGAEADLFASNTEWVARTPLLIVELHDWLLLKSSNSRSFLQCVAELDRDFVIIGEEVYSIANDFDTLARPDVP
jgi:FkbM family methyltransferase